MPDAKVAEQREQMTLELGIDEEPVPSKSFSKPIAESPLRQYLIAHKIPFSMRIHPRTQRAWLQIPADRLAEIEGADWR